MFIEQHQLRATHQERSTAYSGDIYAVETITPSEYASGTDFLGTNDAPTTRRTKISGTVAWHPRRAYREDPGGMFDDGAVVVNVPVGYENLLQKDLMELEVDGKRLRIITTDVATRSGELVLRCRRIT